MDGSPRRATQANRQARRQSPYARPSNPPPQSTPSRLRSVLSYLSPFRSSSKAQRTEEQAETEEESLEEGPDTDVKEEDTDSADEAAQFALHGRQITREASAGIFGQHLPASPTPAQQLKRTLGPSNLSSSFSMPDLASIASPRAPGNFARSPTAGVSEYSASEYGTHGGATEELARFFKEKAERGEEGLTAIEQAGVMHLMQQAQSVPTAFTPNFANSNASFSLPSPSRSASTVQTTSTSQYKRRRPLYVGAGYSSRRRKTNLGTSGLSKSQSEGSLFGLASSDSSDGKRRRTEDDQMEEDIPVASLDDVLVSVPVASTSISTSSTSTASTSTEKAQDKLKSKPSLSRFTGMTTPAKPSPLWQVSKADTPSPSPPRKPSSKASTGAANLVLDVIQQVDAANPVSKPQVSAGKEAILNPYDNAENPLALASKRVPRSSGSGRSKSSTPRASAKTKPVEVAKPKEPEISPLEQLERTMPAEYRKDSNSKRSKVSTAPSSSSASVSTSKPVDKKRKKPVEVVEILSSDGEEEDQLAEDVEEEKTPAPVDLPTKTKKQEVEHKKSASPFSFASSSTPPPSQKDTTSAFGSASSSGFSFSTATKPDSAPPPPAFSLNFGATTSSHSTPPRDTLPPSPSALTPPAIERPSSPKASLPPTAPPTSAPFTFSLPPPPPPSFTSTSPAAPTFSFSAESTSSSSPRVQVAALPSSSLPIHEFDFTSILSSSFNMEVVDAAPVKAVKDLVRNMGKGELPSFMF
ncbi:hypothetical protein JCM5350_007038 [Sporobolomyces pararoseus]